MFECAGFDIVCVSEVPIIYTPPVCVKFLSLLVNFLGGPTFGKAGGIVVCRMISLYYP